MLWFQVGIEVCGLSFKGELNGQRVTDHFVRLMAVEGNVYHLRTGKVTVGEDGRQVSADGSEAVIDNECVVMNEACDKAAEAQRIAEQQAAENRKAWEKKGVVFGTDGEADYPLKRRHSRVQRFAIGQCLPACFPNSALSSA